MKVLVINCGSSSIKADVIEPTSGRRLRSLRVERVGTSECAARIDGTDPRPLGNVDHEDALMELLPGLAADVSAVGHRVVHGGERFAAPVRIDSAVVDAVEALVPLAPLHNPANLAGIRAARRLLPSLVHVAVFDTAFHATLPRRARAYALPVPLAEKHGLRRYGFHGPSHQWVARRAADFLAADIRDLRIVTCHLGNGASAAAVEYGRSVETSMGMTPLEGLVMGTRSGDVDPGALLALARAEGLDLEGLDHLLNRESGLAGLSGVGNDLRDIEARAAEGDDRCRLAIQVFAHRLLKYIGAYAAVMGGVDAIVFTGGIGENSGLMRHRVCQRLGYLGARVDADKNRDARVSHEHPVADISSSTARVRVLVVATDEERAIAQAAAALQAEQDRVETEPTIPIAVSARHIHLTREAVSQLFGPGHTLTVLRPISQPGQFATKETLDVVGPRRRLDGVRIIGPVRKAVQVEISRTDEFHLGIDAPVRNSGDTANSPGITLVGPVGTLTIREGVICARRHIHMTHADAERFGVTDRDVVEVAVDSEGRDLVYGDVLVRVKDSYVLEMHIDTDEANAAELRTGAQGVLSGTGRVARLRKKSTD